MKCNKFIEVAKRTIKMEAEAVCTLLTHIDEQFSGACELLLKSRGRIIVSGMGKSGHIASKIAATLASTGTPAFFVHPAEASHGDMGMITSNDVIIVLSNSGKTQEIVALLPILKRLGTPIISMTGNKDSLLAKSANFNLNVSVEQEACPLNLAPTSSTTATLVMGDALAISLLEARGFTADDFAFSHPGGSLGRRLLLKVQDIMHSGDEFPTVSPNTPLKEALLQMTSKGLGMTAVTHANKLLGIFTDGDLRRALDSPKNIHSLVVKEVMTLGGKTISQNALAAEALKLMQDNCINALIVVDTNETPIGALNMHDMLKAKVI